MVANFLMKGVDMNVRELLSLSPVLPVMVVHDVDNTIKAAQAMFAGGIRTFEITLRTPIALLAISELKHSLPPDAIVGAGTITHPKDLQAAMKAGAEFGVSPGLTDKLTQAIHAEAWPFLPGVASASELMQAMDGGFDTFKLFPAAAIGGIDLLKAWAGPFEHARFCPTGGIHADNAADYLALKNVLAVGGSWLMPTEKVAQQDWLGITTLAQAACSLKAQIPESK